MDSTADLGRADALLTAGVLRRAIFGSASFSSIATDESGVIQIFNGGAERVLGYTASEVLNKLTPADISDADELAALARALSVELGTPISPGFEALAYKASRGIEDIYELTYIRKDATRFPALVFVTALRDAKDAIVGYLLISTDNTARKQLEQERTKLEERLRDQHFYTRSLIESNVDALMTTDRRGVLTDVNKQTEALTGCTRDELIGAMFKDCFTDSLRAESAIRRVLSEGRIANFDLTARARNGDLTVVSYNATTFHDRDQQLRGVLGAARDATELKRFERTLLQKNVELEVASRMKSEFLANMSHELRTPLNAIIGFSEVLKDGLLGEVTAEQRGFIGDIFGSGQHLLSLINDILDLSKVEAGKMSLDLEPVQASSLFTNSLSVIKEKAATRGIHLSVEVPTVLGLICVDARKVTQIVYNLLSNAVKFTPDQGHVDLCARLASHADVGRLSGERASRTIAMTENVFADFLEISVTDDGIGISALEFDRLFQPFSQIDSGLARRFEGTGLGLSMVKLLTELHGGALAVESTVGEGSTFTVWLPLRGLDDVGRMTPEEPRAAPSAEAGEPTAMVVVGDVELAAFVRVELEGEGFEVLHAPSGEAALLLVARHPLSLITLDLTLPDMDGWELLRRIKAVAAVSRIPVLLVSIAREQGRGFLLGAAAVADRPVSRQGLCDSLASLRVSRASPAHPLRVVVLDDDPSAAEQVVVRALGAAGGIRTSRSEPQANDVARHDLPDLIVLDLTKAAVDGRGVVRALRDHPDTARIPILVLTPTDVADDDRLRFDGYVTATLSSADVAGDDFAAEVRRAMSTRAELVA